MCKEVFRFANGRSHDSKILTLSERNIGIHDCFVLFLQSFCFYIVPPKIHGHTFPYYPNSYYFLCPYPCPVIGWNTHPFADWLSQC